MLSTSWCKLLPSKNKRYIKVAKIKKIFTVRPRNSTNSVLSECSLFRWELKCSDEWAWAIGRNVVRQELKHLCMYSDWFELIASKWEREGEKLVLCEQWLRRPSHLPQKYFTHISKDHLHFTRATFSPKRPYIFPLCGNTLVTDAQTTCSMALKNCRTVRKLWLQYITSSQEHSKCITLTEKK